MIDSAAAKRFLQMSIVRSLPAESTGPSGLPERPVLNHDLGNPELLEHHKFVVFTHRQQFKLIHPKCVIVETNAFDWQPHDWQSHL